jgi:hypothetical protein
LRKWGDHLAEELRALEESGTTIQPLAEHPWI